MHSFGRGR